MDKKQLDVIPIFHRPTDKAKNVSIAEMVKLLFSIWYWYNMFIVNVDDCTSIRTDERKLTTKYYAQNWVKPGYQYNSNNVKIIKVKGLQNRGYKNRINILHYTVLYCIRQMELFEVGWDFLSSPLSLLLLLVLELSDTCILVLCILTSCSCRPITIWKFSCILRFWANSSSLSLRKY